MATGQIAATISSAPEAVTFNPLSVVPAEEPGPITPGSGFAKVDCHRASWRDSAVWVLALRPGRQALVSSNSPEPIGSQRREIGASQCPQSPAATRFRIQRNGVMGQKQTHFRANPRYSITSLAVASS